MASKPVILKIQPREKKPIRTLPKEISIYIQGSTNDLYHRISAEANFDIHRLRITKEDGTLVPNDKSVSVDSTGLNNGSTIQVKDLGLQIAWRTVFIVEYIGPIIIHALFYTLRPQIYGLSKYSQPSYLQTLSFWMIVIHFSKREFETLFVHRFSNATMPLANIFKNSGHYWLISGLLMAYFIYAPNSPTAAESIPALTYAGLALYSIGEVGNLITHVILRNLRTAGTGERGIPTGFGFDIVTCPNYTYEATAWIGILLVSRSWTTLVFIALSVFFMTRWALKKEKRYRKELGPNYQKKRYAIFPGII